VRREARRLSIEDAARRFEELADRLDRATAAVETCPIREPSPRQEARLKYEQLLNRV
jgi:hypothetical protein